MKIEKLLPGQVVYSVERRKMGNTTMKTTSVFKVRIVEIDPEKQWVLASWNGNTPSKFYRRTVGKWREKKPVMIIGNFGSQRLATREEIKAMEQAKKLREIEDRIKGHVEGFEGFDFE
jgi:hypothetical protein